MDTSLHPFQKLVAPVQFIAEIDGVELWIKREDLIHQQVSGNKWRKLKYYLADFEKSGKTEILTFGGAFSNHLAATAAIGRLMNIGVKALVRGEEVKNNPTLDFCSREGMIWKGISRESYQKKDTLHFIKELEIENPHAYIIPEGGKGLLGIKGCMEILDDVEESFDRVCCAAGTATTFTGLLLSGYEAYFEMYPALKGGGFLAHDVENYLAEFSTSHNGKNEIKPPYSIKEDYHFGGYGKVRPELITFMNDFYRKYQIPLDPVYTGKMLYGVLEGIKQGNCAKGERILAIHTGGLQGIEGMNKRLQHKDYQLNYAI